MRIQPRREILDIWRSVVRSSFQDGSWTWGGRDEPNSISDAEQLLCLLYPPTELTNLALHQPDDMAADVRDALERLGDPVSIPHLLVEVLAEYLDRYTDEHGEPIFASGSYLRTKSHFDGPDAAGPQQQVTEAQRAIAVVDSYSMSVTLCLAALGYMVEYRPAAGARQALIERLGRLEQGFRDRLTCAMIGLVRSFVVRTVPATDGAYHVMLEMFDQAGADHETILEQLRFKLSRIRARLRDDVRIGVHRDERGLSDGDQLFECGWGWGIARNAPAVHIALDEFSRTTQPGIGSLDGLADPRPYLYSTAMAVYSINDLRSLRTRELGLLTDDQRRLNEALQLRADITQRYWSIVARLSEENWPLEDVPWRTSDGEESDYYSLLVAAMVVQDMLNREALDDHVSRMTRIVDTLAERGRITRRVTPHDTAVELHEPGVLMRLDGAETQGPSLYLSTADFAPLLLKNTLQLVRLSADVKARDQLMRLAEAAMDHLRRRRISDGTAAGLWDDPEVLFPGQGRKPLERPSWYLTVRVVEALIAAAVTFSDPPLRSAEQELRALDLLREADHLLNQEMLGAVADHAILTSIEVTLTIARQILGHQPGTASVLAAEALSRLMALSVGTASVPDPRLGFPRFGPLDDKATEDPQLVQPYFPERASGGPAGALVPVSIHLESTAHAIAVEQAILDVLYTSGFVIEEAKPAVAGSWLRVMSARLKGKADSGDILARIERALEIQALHRPQAEIDSAQADAVAKLITALSHDQNAFIQIGSVFLIKVDGVTVVRNLTQQELAYLQRNSHILVSPGKILQALDDLATGSDDAQTPQLSRSKHEPHTTTERLGHPRSRETDKIIIERRLVRVSVCRPDLYGNVDITLDNGQGMISSYNVDFSTQNGIPPKMVSPVGVSQVRISPDGTALLHEPRPTLSVKSPPNFPHEIEMILDIGDGPITYTLEFPVNSDK